MEEERRGEERSEESRREGGEGRGSICCLFPKGYISTDGARLKPAA